MAHDFHATPDAPAKSFDSGKTAPLGKGDGQDDSSASRAMASTTIQSLRANGLPDKAHQRVQYRVANEAGT